MPELYWKPIRTHIHCTSPVFGVCIVIKIQFGLVLFVLRLRCKKARFIAIISTVCVLFLGVEGAFSQTSSASPTLINRVLMKADASLTAGRFVQPSHNNAYDRYRAVLQIDPNNQRAAEGLNKILLAYLRMADTELTQGSRQHATTFLRLLEERFPDRSEVEALRKRMALLPRDRSMPVVNDFSLREIALNAEELKAKSAAIKRKIEEIAKHVAGTHEAVLIVARNDAEGRWIYQTMNAATPSYRVRGDIQIRNKPAIHLLKPL